VVAEKRSLDAVLNDDASHHVRKLTPRRTRRAFCSTLRSLLGCSAIRFDAVGTLIAVLLIKTHCEACLSV
jgi:hypothetical protein